jgi:hypothetical protein
LFAAARYKSAAMTEIRSAHSGVMAGLAPAIHVLLAETWRKDVDARDKRDKRGHDGAELILSHENVSYLIRN